MRSYSCARPFLLPLVLAAAVLADWTTYCPPAGAALDDLERRLKTEKVDLARIGRELEANRKEIAALEGRERKISKRVALTERKIDLLQEYLRGLRQEEAGLKTEVESTQVRLRRAHRRLQRYEWDFSQRLVRIYKQREVRMMEVLLSPNTTLTDLLARHRYLAAIARQDARDFERVKEEKTGIERLGARLSGDYQKKLALDKETSTQQTVLEEAKRSQQALLSQVQGSIDLKRELAEGLDADRRRSQAAIERIIEAIRQEEERARQQREAQRRREGGSEQRVIEGALSDLGGLASQKGLLRWPATGRVLARFGKHRDPKLNTFTFNRGIDIDVRRGSSVRAVAPGKTVMADWFRGYGKFVLLYHGGDYFTLYGCLSEVYVAVGTRVDEGEVIALSGDTGALGQPKLHFEVLRGKEALDPLGWLSPP